eukprot:GHUV01043399.1.p2 GENE.GHUV01043399.1~~GHUV01043399.1.p2  ORF type:complete len:100 (+),score=10.06 GHUV01043399.1:2-301(+)
MTHTATADHGRNDFCYKRLSTQQQHTLHAYERKASTAALIYAQQQILLHIGVTFCSSSPHGHTTWAPSAGTICRRCPPTPDEDLLIGCIFASIFAKHHT